MQLRSFRASDTDALVKIYRDTVRRIGPDFYTASQVEAWAAYPEDVDDFAHRLSRGHTLIVDTNGTVQAFAQLDPIDFVSFIYTSADVARQGVGTRLLNTLEDYAFSRGVVTIRTEASRIARAFFHKRGYQVENLLHLTHFGVEFEWYCMAKTQASIPPSLD